MIYATLSLWLIVSVMTAWGVHSLWCGLTRRRALEWILFPGTAVAQLGRTVALLLTGATPVTMSPGKGESGGEVIHQPKMPVVGPVLVALLPMLAIGAAMFIVIAQLGGPVVQKLPTGLLAAEAPLSLTAIWEQARRLITLSEGTVNAVRGAGGETWQIVLFAYLMVCLTVPLAPIPGNVRGHVGAVAVLGIVAALLGTVSSGPPSLIAQNWPILSLAVGWLLVLLFISLIVYGVVRSIQLVVRLDS